MIFQCNWFQLWNPNICLRNGAKDIWLMLGQWQWCKARWHSHSVGLPWCFFLGFAWISARARCEVHYWVSTKNDSYFKGTLSHDTFRTQGVKGITSRDA